MFFFLRSLQGFFNRPGAVSFCLSGVRVLSLAGMQNSARSPDLYRQSRLYQLINQSMPPLHQIETELRAIDPGLVADLLLTEPETVFIIDYYFRLFDHALGGSILSHPAFEIGAAVELYNCQVVRYYRSHLHSQDHDFRYASLLESYWSHVEKEKLLLILKQLITGGKSNLFSIVMILQGLDISRLDFLARDKNVRSQAMLDLFKNIGDGVFDLIANNLDLYDFVYKIALDLKDQDYVKFLDEYTRFIVQLRIGQTLADDAVGRADAGTGRIPFKDLVEMLPMIPEESLGITLQIFEQKKLIDPETVRGILELHYGAGDGMS